MFEGDTISAQADAGARGTLPTMLPAPRQKSRKGGKAIHRPKPALFEPSRDIPQASRVSLTNTPSPAENELSGHHCGGDQCLIAAQPYSVGQFASEALGHPADRTTLPGQLLREPLATDARQPNTDCGHHWRDDLKGYAAVGEPDAHQGQMPSDAHEARALVGKPLSDEGQSKRESQFASALVGEITAVYRRYEDLRRARQRIELQAIATCRNVCGGDKTEGMKLYKSPTPQVEAWLTPYRLAMQPLDAAIKEQEKLLTKFGKALPVREWADSVPGLSPRFLAAIIGECGIGPGEFKSVSALWKRMGMAVINGGRQRRVTGDAAIEHGYVARRRALMWNIGDQVAVRQGIRNPKDEEGNKAGAVAINEWGALYLERKAYELARETEPGKPLTPMHAHNRAKRYVEKRMLRSLWQEWRRAGTRAESSKASLGA